VNTRALLALDFDGDPHSDLGSSEARSPKIRKRYVSTIF
jgi:hypothetical protein